MRTDGAAKLDKYSLLISGFDPEDAFWNQLERIVMDACATDELFGVGTGYAYTTFKDLKTLTALITKIQELQIQHVRTDAITLIYAPYEPLFSDPDTTPDELADLHAAYHAVSSSIVIITASAMSCYSLHECIESLKSSQARQQVFCEQCGKAFITTRPNKVYCNQACNAKAANTRKKQKPKMD